MVFEAGHLHGDGTIDLRTWKHLRNLAWTLRDMARILTAMEENTDPDEAIIPF